MKDKQKILDKLKTLEALFSAGALECQQTRKLIEEEVSTPTNVGLSEIAIKARLDVRSRILKGAK